MRPREEGHSGQVDHHLAILSTGLSRAIRQRPVDVVVGDPLNGADGATPSGEIHKAPGAVAGILAHPGAPRDGLKARGLVRSARHFTYGKMVNDSPRPVGVTRSLQPRAPYSFREPKVNPRPGDVVRRKRINILHLNVQSLKQGPNPGPSPVPWIHGDRLRFMEIIPAQAPAPSAVPTNTIQAAQLSRQPGNPKLRPPMGGPETENRIRGPTVLPGVWSIAAAPSGPLAHAYVAAIVATFRCTQAGDCIP